MKTRILLSSIVAGLVIFSAQTVAVAITAEQPAKIRKVLNKGMEAAAVLKFYGKPAEVQIIGFTGANAEKWIYRRKAKEYTTQTASGVIMIPAFVGINGDGAPMLGETPVLDFKTKFVTVHQVTALLMVEGKLVLGKQWLEQEEKFTN